MTELQIEAKADEVGFDAGRLARIDQHFARYVDDGRLPGWLIAIARHGRIAHLSTYGQRDMEDGQPVELDTLFRIYSMTKPITAVAALLLYEEGAFELKDPIHRFIPAFRRHAGLPLGVGVRSRDRARRRADPHVAPVHPHRRAHLRLPPRASRRRDVPRRRLRVGHAARPGSRRVL